MFLTEAFLQRSPRRICRARGCSSPPMLYLFLVVAQFCLPYVPIEILPFRFRAWTCAVPDLARLGGLFATTPSVAATLH